MKTVAVVPAAGTGKRLGLKTKKPFILLAGRPLVTYVLAALDSSQHIDGIIIAVESSYVRRMKTLVKKYGFTKVIDVVIGGATRFGSVKNCLKSVGRSFDIVLIHDAARPFLDEALIEGAITMAAKYGACVTAIPETDTTKLVDNALFIKTTIDRRSLYRAQTPQAFRRDLVMRAYAAKRKREITDDSTLVENLGRRVKILEGSCRNIKVTTKEDLKIAEALLCE